ncbi:hypothetical protein HXX01_05505, partial [Candidatus Nomurabacteria bacterium]|nr:hypothetical protein [Candidatus Nomurabacteria bacterium]
MKRLDQFDYEALGTRERWIVGEAIDMFTSLEMEIKEYFLREDLVTVFDKIHAKYWTYLTDLMCKGLLPYVTVCAPEDEFFFQEQGCDLKTFIREFNTIFDKEALLKCIIDDNKMKINIERLNGFLSGDDVPVLITLPELPKEGIVFEKVVNIAKKVKTSVETQKQGNQVGTNDELSKDAILTEIIADIKYPVYKGLALNELTKETFEEIKKTYGMLLV